MKGRRFFTGLLGALIGYAIYRWPSERVRDALITLSDVTTNFAGAPLAFAFVVILGLNGVITQFLIQYFHYELYPGFSIYSFGFPGENGKRARHNCRPGENLNPQRSEQCHNLPALLRG